MCKYDDNDNINRINNNDDNIEDNNNNFYDNNSSDHRHNNNNNNDHHHRNNNNHILIASLSANSSRSNGNMRGEMHLSSGQDEPGGIETKPLRRQDLYASDEA